MASRIFIRPLPATRAGAQQFVGRDQELAAVEENVDAGANTLVLAERGGGLTSFLNRVAYNLEERGDRRVVMLPGEAARGASDLLAAVADRLAASPQGAPAVVTPDRPEYSTDDTAVLLWRLDRIARLVATDETPAVVMIDGVASAAVAHTVFGQLRNELWQMEGITWVLGGAASQRGHYLEPPADAFWESVITLPPFSEGELSLLLMHRKLAGLAQNTLKDVRYAASGSAVKAILLAQAAQEGRFPGQQEQDAELSDSAARLLHYLQANGPSSASDKGLLAELGWTRGRAQQVLKSLDDAGLVRSEPASTDGSPGRPRKVFYLTEQR